VIDDAMAPELERGGCPHVAVLLRSHDELPEVLASFYALGAKRGGWLVHRVRPGEADADRAILTEAGLDVAGLESSGRLQLVELDPDKVTPEEYPLRWREQLDRALADGYTGLWYSRYAVGPDESWYDLVVPYEKSWDAAFHGLPVVQLCPFLVSDLDAGATLDRLGRVSAIHGEGVLVPDAAEPGGYRLLRPA
jgi:hypothetical protein